MADRAGRAHRYRDACDRTSAEDNGTIVDLNDPTLGAASSGPGHVVALRPLTVSDTLDGIVRLFRAIFGRAVLVVVVITGPFQLASSLVFDRILPTSAAGFGLPMPGADVPQVEFDMTVVAQILMAGVVLAIVSVLVGLVVAGALVALADAADRAETLSAGTAIGIAFKRLGATLGATLLLMCAGIAAMIALGVVLVPMMIIAPPVGFVALFGSVMLLGLFGAALSYLIVPIALTEATGPVATFRRALWVARYRFGRLMGITILVAVLVLAVTASVTAAFFALSFVAGPFAWVIDGVNSTVVSIVSAPVTTLAAFLVHLDARIRLEGFDLTVRAARLGPSDG